MFSTLQGFTSWATTKQKGLKEAKDGVDEQLAREVWATCENARFDAEREAVSSPPPPPPPPQQQPSEGAPVDAVLDLLGLDWRSNVTRPPPLEELLIASREEHARLEAYCGALGKKAACKGDEHCAYISATAECTVAASAVYDALGVAGWGERWESGWAAAGVGGEVLCLYSPPQIRAKSLSHMVKGAL